MSKRARAVAASGAPTADDDGEGELGDLPRLSEEGYSDFGNAFAFERGLFTQAEAASGNPHALIPGSLLSEEQFAQLPANEQKKQRRLIRNRQSAQQHRLRQRAHFDAMETQITELACVVRELQARLQATGAAPPAVLRYVPPSQPGVLGYTGETKQRLRAIYSAVMAGLLGPGVAPIGRGGGEAAVAVAIGAGAGDEAEVDDDGSNEHLGDDDGGDDGVGGLSLSLLASGAGAAVQTAAIDPFAAAPPLQLQRPTSLPPRTTAAAEAPRSCIPRQLTDIEAEAGLFGIPTPTAASLPAAQAWQQQQQDQQRYPRHHRGSGGEGAGMFDGEGRPGLGAGLFVNPGFARTMSLDPSPLLAAPPPALSGGSGAPLARGADYDVNTLLAAQGLKKLSYNSRDGRSPVPAAAAALPPPPLLPGLLHMASFAMGGATDVPTPAPPSAVPMGPLGAPAPPPRAPAGRATAAAPPVFYGEDAASPSAAIFTLTGNSGALQSVASFGGSPMP